MEDSEKQDILDKGMEMLEQMRAGFGMQSHAIDPSLPGAGESVSEDKQLTQLQQVFPGTGEPQAHGKSYLIGHLIEATGSKLNCHTV